MPQDRFEQPAIDIAIDEHGTITVNGEESIPLDEFMAFLRHRRGWHAVWDGRKYSVDHDMKYGSLHPVEDVLDELQDGERVQFDEQYADRMIELYRYPKSVLGSVIEIARGS